MATTIGSFGATTDAIVHSADVTAADDILLSVGTGQTARFSWDTTDANANEMLLQFPAGGSVDVPVLVVGQAIESVDLGLYNGVVDPRFCFLSAGAWTTGSGIDFRKARGTATSPTVVTSGDDVGTIRGYACVAAGEWVQTAEIRMDCAGTVATTRGPGTMTFLTATDAAPSVLTQAMAISAAQVVTLAAGVTTGNHTFSNTITAGADGVGANGEQLTSGGAAAECTWAAAGSMRAFKNVLGILTEKAQDALDRVLTRDVYAFQYKSPEEAEPGLRLTTTGDRRTVYHGVMADEYPEVMHHDGRIFSPVSAFGELMLAIKALAARIEELEAVRA